MTDRTRSTLRCEWCGYEGTVPDEIAFGPGPSGETIPQCVDTDACDRRQQVNAEREEVERQSVIKSQRGADDPNTSEPGGDNESRGEAVAREGPASVTDTPPGSADTTNYQGATSSDGSSSSDVPEESE